MRGKEKYIIFALILAVAVCVLMLIYQNRSAETVVYPDAEITVRVSKDKLIELLGENGIRLSGKARMAASALPDTLTLLFDTGGKGKGALSELSVNGIKISHEVLEDICENYLDFSCTLVYNKT